MANTTKFPNGMGHVADHLHSMGFGFGMYSSAGTYTCAQYGRSFVARECVYRLIVTADSCFSGPRETRRTNLCRLGC